LAPIKLEDEIGGGFVRRKEGFTLVELLIVLAVIAALMATITPVALNAVRRAKASQIAENLRNIKTAIENYYYTESTDATYDAVADDLIGVLVTNHYLNTDPGDNYVATTSDSWTNGELTVMLRYIGGDVALSQIQKVWSEVTNLGTGVGVGVTFTIAKYW